ncbi:tRNA modification GTPase MnmE [compost metagenome]
MLSAKDKIKNTDVDMLSKIQNKGLKMIVVINKMDEMLKSIFDANMIQLKEIGIDDCIEVSILEDTGTDKIKNSILDMFKKYDLDYNQDLILVNKRHKELLSKAYELLLSSKNEISNDSSIDIVAISIKQIAKYLGEIIGADVSIDIVNKIFEKFCLGK